jgi:DNA-binding IclR family transcriptional regulator
VPVLDGLGAVAAALSVSVSIARWGQEPVEHWIELARAGAADLSGELGYREPAGDDAAAATAP